MLSDLSTRLSRPSLISPRLRSPLRFGSQMEPEIPPPNVEALGRFLEDVFHRSRRAHQDSTDHQHRSHSGHRGQPQMHTPPPALLPDGYVELTGHRSKRRHPNQHSPSDPPPFRPGHRPSQLSPRANPGRNNSESAPPPPFIFKLPATQMKPLISLLNQLWHPSPIESITFTLPEVVPRSSRESETGQRHRPSRGGHGAGSSQSSRSARQPTDRTSRRGYRPPISPSHSREDAVGARAFLNRYFRYTFYDTTDDGQLIDTERRPDIIRFYQGEPEQPDPNKFILKKPYRFKELADLLLDTLQNGQPVLGPPLGQEARAIQIERRYPYPVGFKTGRHSPTVIGLNNTIARLRYDYPRKDDRTAHLTLVDFFPAGDSYLRSARPPSTP